MNLEFKGQGDLCLTVVNHYTKEIIIGNRPINPGLTQLPELSIDGFYDLYPYMKETDEFGLDIQSTNLQVKKGVGAIDYNNLINCRLPIKDIIVDEERLSLEYKYFIHVFEKIDDNQYLGKIFRVALIVGKEDWNSKKLFGKVKIYIYQNDNDIKISLTMYSYNEEEWLAPYYDKKRRRLLGCDDRLLDRVKEYSRFDKYKF